jgi:hypothetical protein
MFCNFFLPPKKQKLRSLIVFENIQKDDALEEKGIEATNIWSHRRH